MLRAMDAVGGFCRQGGAKCAGVHLEGPFLSAGKRGAQAERNIRLPDRALFDQLNAACGGQVPDDHAGLRVPRGHGVHPVRVRSRPWSLWGIRSALTSRPWRLFSAGPAT